MGDVKQHLKESVEMWKKDIEQDPNTAFEYALDVVAKVNTKGQIIGGEVLLGYGGPTIIMTILPNVATIEGYWGRDYECELITNDEVVDALFERLKAYFVGVEIRE